MEETAPQISEKKSMNKGIFIAVLVVVIALAIVGYETTQPKTDTTQSANSAPATTAPKKADEAEVMTASTYKNGTYTVTGNYTSPGGPEEIDV
ncbi:MAG: hypothetical protein AAB553_07940, partial [Patescibacteria group bacterium]